MNLLTEARLVPITAVLLASSTLTTLQKNQGNQADHKTSERASSGKRGEIHITGAFVSGSIRRRKLS